MGICYSKTGNKREASSGENEHDGKTNIKLNLKKSSSGEFATFLSKLTGGGAAVAAAEERALHQIPGRLFSNGANSIACLYTQQGKKGTNQDAMIVWENFCTRSNTNTIFCGVFDGHGPFGHMVARKVRDSLPFLFREEWEAKSDSEQISANENGNNEGMIRFDKFMDDDGFDSIEIEDNEKLPEVHMPLKRSMLRAFKLMDKQLKLHPTIDCFCSGTTAVTMIMQDQDLIIGNIGDSRGVLATRDEGNSLKAVQLTVDLKPNLPREAARIQKCKGRVFALQDEPEVARVWLPNSDSPGLAMARAFGDFCLKDFGLISVPDIYYHQVTKGDEFVILATDGVWDVLSNKEAVDIVASAPSRATAARALVDCATRAWRLKYPTSKNDDCAVVCLFLQQVPQAIMAKAQNITTLPEAEMNKVPKEEGHPNSSNIETVASPADNITTNSEVDMTKVPNEGSTEGSNIDIVGDKDEESRAALAIVGNNIIRDSELEMEVRKEGYIDVVASHSDVLVYSDNVIESSEIEPVVEPVGEEKLPGTTLGQSRRSLAECLSSTEDEEWSALEGVTRVNSLLSLPRFLSFEKRSASWRKWL